MKNHTHEILVYAGFDPDTATSIIQQFYKKEQRKPDFDRADLIIETVLNYFDLPADEFFCKGRNGKQSRARMHICAQLYNKSGLSYKLIGNKIQRDHSTVIYNCQKHSDYIVHDWQYAYEAKEIEKEIDLIFNFESES